MQYFIYKYLIKYLIKILCKNCFRYKEKGMGRVFNGINIFSVGFHGYLYTLMKKTVTPRPHFSLSLICCSCNTKGESETLLIRSPRVLLANCVDDHVFDPLS